jgi:glyoxylase-like metal-dependent hydrolase (beta-lactamase superfamily II)
MTEHRTTPHFINGRYRAILQPLFKLLLFCVISQGQSVLAADGELVNPDTVARDWSLPERAINSQQIPEFKLDADAADTRPLPVYRLRDNSYFLFGSIATLDKHNRGWNGNAGFVVTGDGVVVIDSLGTPLLGKRLIATIRSITQQPIKYLIITHNHPDHAYGASAFRQLEGITIIAHQGTVDYNHSATLQSSVDYRQQMLTRDMQGFEPVKADIYIKPPPFRQQQIKLGNSRFDIYNTGKHHSYGDLVIHQPEQKILWVSDLVFNQRTTYMGDGDSAQILRAQDWLLQTFADTELMVPGHGSAQTSPFPMLKRTHDYVSRMRVAMRKAVEDGVSLSEAVQQVEFPDWQDSRLYEQNQRANANFVYREMEKAFFENF